MEGVAMGKMKRKDLDEVFDDFSEFSLSSPAKKIRRLDVELPPIMEEEEHAAVPIEAPMADVAPSQPLNEERALVLYRPIDPQLLVGPGPSSLSFHVNSDLIPGLKDQFFDRAKGKKETLALVPWNPTNQANAINNLRSSEPKCEIKEETMDEAEDTSMEVELEREESDRNGEVELHQWKQQHCTVTPPFRVDSATSPVMWSW